MFGTHPDHGFVACATPTVSRHLADWFLTREQFEPVPGDPGLFRLIEPERDGPRRTRQAVHDLRVHGYAVYADVALDPAAPGPAVPDGRRERRRLAQAAAGAPSTRRAIPPKPAYAPTVHLSASGNGRSR